MNPSATGTGLLILFAGGGACWDYQTCFVLNTSAHGPFGAAEFASVSSGLGGGVLDRAEAQNPFKDYSLVFVPYCTGDLHAGDVDTSYSSGGGAPRVMHHRGQGNVRRYLERIAATFPAAAKVVVAGMSSGGVGAALSFPLVRATWPGAAAYLIHDSLPLLEGDSIPAAIRAQWFANWGLAAVIDPLCGTPCHDDLSLAFKSLAARYPNDRMALLSSTQDAVARGYFLLTAQGFETALRSLAAVVLGPTPRFRHFFETGQGHTMLGAPGSHAAGATPLWTWLGRMIGDDAAWADAE